tara:strand:+ start:2519 stop:3559 length:1041 start_codon:yes stop_codon:yes gene_type:complete
MMDKTDAYFSISLLFSFLTLILSIVFINIYILLAKKFGFFSVPHKGGVRKDIIPTSGGISFSCLYLLMVITLNIYFQIPKDYFYSILFGSGLMAITGFIDDIYSLSSSIRLCIQLMFVTMICFFFGIENFLYNNIDYFIIFPVIIISSIWLINTFNFIDGADGLVSTNSCIFSFVGGIYLLMAQQEALASLLFILSAVNMGFLFFNWSPAKIFMGDSGSLFLGSLFVIFCIGSYTGGYVTYWTWIILLSVFYVETTVTLLVRIKRKENVFSVHHSHHAYQQIIITSGKHNRPALASIFINLFWTVPMSFISFIYPEIGFVIAVITCLPLSLIFYFFGPYQTKPDGN